jgi:hypothetical protein
VTRRRGSRGSTRGTANRASAQLLLAFLIVVLVVAFYATRDPRFAYVIGAAAIFGVVAERLLLWRAR